MHTTTDTTARACADRTEGERLPEYAARVLRYAITYGLTPLTLSQLELADATAQGCVAAFPQTLNQDDARQDAALHALRLRLQARAAEKRAQLAQLQRLIDACDQDTQHAVNGPQGNQGNQDGPEQTDQERALQLLRAALTLIMQPPPPGSQDGGKGARLQRPTPNRPPGTNALQPPTPDAGPRRF
jgi:hypothetical protein